MANSSISIEVDPDTAKAYSAATDQEKRKLQLLLRLGLREMVANPPRSLAEVMDEIGHKVQARGLTPEILESLLHDD